jgi:hypothetical protein
LKRLKAWGFTTVGGWSDFQVLRHCGNKDVAFAPVLHIGSTAGAPWWDMWGPKITDRTEAVAREQILVLRDDPRLAGYYSDDSRWVAIELRLQSAPSLIVRHPEVCEAGGAVCGPDRLPRCERK